MKNLSDLSRWLRELANHQRYTHTTHNCDCNCAGAGGCPHTLITVYDWPHNGRRKIMYRRQISRYVICRN